LLVVDGLATMRAQWPELEPVLAEIAAAGPQAGVHLAVSANRWADIRPALLDAIATRVELRLNDPADSAIDRRAAAALPTDRPGRGLVTGGYEVQIARAGEDVLSAIADRWAGHPVAPQMAVLPGRLTLPDIPPCGRDPPA